LLGALVSVQGLSWCPLRRAMCHCYFFLYDIAALLLLFYFIFFLKRQACATGAQYPFSCACHRPLPSSSAERAEAHMSASAAAAAAAQIAAGAHMSCDPCLSALVSLPQHQHHQHHHHHGVHGPSSAGSKQRAKWHGTSIGHGRPFPRGTYPSRCRGAPWPCRIGFKLFKAGRSPSISGQS
jgi:hypothetical protein